MRRPWGQVVGVATARRRGGENLNFAVPASEVRQFLKRPCNSRELWRGTGIIDEEFDAYGRPAFADLANGPRGRGGAEKVVESMWKANRQAAHMKYAEALDVLHTIAPSSCGEFEYLLHYTIGRAASGLSFGKGWNPQPNDKNFQLAIESFRKAIALKPDFSPAYFELAWQIRREETGRFAEALAVADSLVKLVPRCSRAYQLRAHLLNQTKRHLEALPDLRTAAELSPNNPRIHGDIGLHFSRQGEYPEAIEAYKSAIQLAQASGRSSMETGYLLLELGRCYENVGKYELAVGCFEKAKSVDCDPKLCDERIAACRAAMKGR